MIPVPDDSAFIMSVAEPWDEPISDEAGLPSWGLGFALHVPTLMDLIGKADAGYVTDRLLAGALVRASVFLKTDDREGFMFDVLSSVRHELEAMVLLCLTEVHVDLRCCDSGKDKWWRSSTYMQHSPRQFVVPVSSIKV